MTEMNLSIKCKGDENIVITKQKRAEWLFAYQMIGATTPKDERSINAMALICGFNKGELALLKKCTTGLTLSPHNKLQLRKKDMKLPEQRLLGPAVVSWIKKGILIREMQEHYMVSPYFLVPEREHHSVVMYKWNEALLNSRQKESSNG